MSGLVAGGRGRGLGGGGGVGRRGLSVRVGGVGVAGGGQLG